jgi:hypothetical protein
LIIGAGWHGLWPRAGAKAAGNWWCLLTSVAQRAPHTAESAWVLLVIQHAWRKQVQSPAREFSLSFW